jgi:hypothetical protein
MLSVVRISVSMLSIFMNNIHYAGCIVMLFLMLNVIMLSAFVLNDMAPCLKRFKLKKFV